MYLYDNIIKLNTEQYQKLDAFKKLLSEYNNAFNLTSITDSNETDIKHFYDSLAGAEFFPEGAKVIEIGSGGGFPSIPLKIARDDLDFTLTEATGKKCGFLETVIKELGLKKIRVINERAENLAKKEDFREKFDCVTARAVAKLNTLSEYCIPFIKTGGLFIAYKGEAQTEIKEASNALKILGGKLKEVYNYNLPEDMGVRSLIITEKISSTDKKYPRGQGKERSKPL